MSRTLRFRRFQCLRDLRALMSSFGAGPLAAIVERIPGLPPAAALEPVLRGTGRLDSRTAAFHPALALAAALPEEDLDGFVLATALLLSDRLQDGAGADDLYWHYDAHLPTYLRLVPDMRSALLMAYTLLDAEERVSLDPAPPAEALHARPGGLVRAALTAASPSDTAVFRAALRGGPTEEAEALWRSDAARLVRSPSVAGAARHLYAARDDWDPYRAWSDARIAAEGIAIPFPCALPLPHEVL